uniref:Uncharacterized protein n=1 Tax=Romanomermis culicivorax TaxID=13658 RepID=A0A915I852_ROMCU
MMTEPTWSSGIRDQRLRYHCIISSGAIGPTLLASLITTILILLPKDDSNASVVPQTEEKKLE